VIWGFPAAFYFAALAIPVVAAFFYRRFARVHEVPALAHWLELGRATDVHSWSSWLRRLLTLLVQLLLLLALVLALADPAPRRQLQRTVIILDVGVSMQTCDATGCARIVAAREQALKMVATLDPDGQIAVLQAGQCPVLLASPTRDVRKVRAAIAAVESLDLDSDLLTTLTTARALVAADVPTDVVLFSDFAGVDLKGLRASWLSPAHLLLVPVGQDMPDAAITNMWTESDTRGRRVVALLEQRGLTNRRVSVVLHINDDAVATQEVVLKDSVTRVEFRTPLAPGATYDVVVHADDTLSADDRAYGLVPQYEQLGICLVTDGDPVLERALRADPNVRLRVIGAAELNSAANDDVVIVDHVAIPVLPGAVRGWLFLGVGDPQGWAKPRAAAPCGLVTHWAGAHPLMADVDPTLLRIPAALPFDWNAAAKVTELVSANMVPLIVEAVPAAPAPGAAARYIYWLFDLQQTDLARRLTFPLLLWNTVDYLATGETEHAEASHLTGIPLKLQRRQPAVAPVVQGPDGRRIPVKTNADVDLLLDTSRAGIYRQDGEPAYAVNLFSRRGLCPLPAPAELARQSDLAQIQPTAWDPWLPRPLRNALLGLGVLVGLAEWLLFHRRVIRIG